jgi:hypothetical protein
MGRRWTIENVPEETINAIKQRSVDYGVSIAQVLVTEFGGQDKLERKNNWTIWNMPDDLRQRIIRLAKKSNKTVPNLLETLLENKNQTEMEKDLKEQLIYAVNHCLKEFKKS